MDIFKYQAALAELNGCKYIKDLSTLVRKWHNNYRSSYNDYLEIKYIYKLYTHALNLYAIKTKTRLPDFLYNDHISVQKNIIYNLVTNNINYLPLHKYEELIDCFEFDTIVETPRYNSIEILHSIILDKPLHFKFIFNEKLSSFDIHSLNSVSEYNKRHIHAIRLKQTLSPNTPATVLEQYLEETLAGIIRHKDVSTDIILLQQQLTALQTYQSTYGEHCGQS